MNSIVKDMPLDFPSTLSLEAETVRRALVARGLETPLIANDLTRDDKYEAIKRAMTDVVTAIGLDLTDDSLQETPHRIAKMYSWLAFQAGTSKALGSTPRIMTFIFFAKKNVACPKRNFISLQLQLKAARVFSGIYSRVFSDKKISISKQFGSQAKIFGKHATLRETTQIYSGKIPTCAPSLTCANYLHYFGCGKLNCEKERKAIVADKFLKF